MWIIKLGGSLLGKPELAQWLEIIVQQCDGKVVIVPGGGILADAVREVQKLSNVGDAVAHQMALLAMDQYGMMLAGLNPALVTASSELEIAERGWQHRGIVWLPSKMVLADETIPKNWQVTSDSLAAWLATKLGAEQLILVKSKRLVKSKQLNVDANPAQMTIQAIYDEVLIDEAFTEFCESSYQTWLVHKSDFYLFEHGFSLRALAHHAVEVVG
ncbi:MAG: uridylate kinase [Methylotenera sp.]|nr:uridylate kinase [Methylotenera sp.]